MWHCQRVYTVPLLKVMARNSALEMKITRSSNGWTYHRRRNTAISSWMICLVVVYFLFVHSFYYRISDSLVKILLRCMKPETFFVFTFTRLVWILVIYGCMHQSKWVNYIKLPHLRRGGQVGTILGDFFKNLPAVGLTTTNSADSLDRKSVV